MMRVSLRGIRSQFLAALASLILFSSAVVAQQMTEQHLLLDGWIAEDGSRVHLTWNDVASPSGLSVDVYRRHYGMTGGQTWTLIEVEEGPGRQVVDETTQPGLAYEYRVIRRNPDGGVRDIGYWLAGRDLPLPERNGIIHLVVEQSVLERIEPHLVRFQRDLIGEGWQVRRYAMPRHRGDAALENLNLIGGLKQQLMQAYEDADRAKHVVILVGHVPLALSGMGAPDGHGTAPHPTDLIYGDVDGRWQLAPDGTLRNTRLPSDRIEMQVGRIDFATIVQGDLDHEIRLLQDYFDKNHNWRHGRHGDLREAYGEGPGLIGEISSLRNVVGPDAITEGGHHDVGEAQPWLWGVDFGDPGGHTYSDRFSNRAVFAINFGSHKQRIDRQRNAMVGLLAQPWFTVAVGWGARPAWWLHHMSLGGSIGDVHMRTVNNGVAAEPYSVSMDYYPTGRFLWRNPVWVNLLGDPTLRAFPLAPPTNFRADQLDDRVELNWSPSPDADTVGYVVYAIEDDGRPTVISGATPLSGTTLIDPQPRQLYMVRSVGVKQVHAGSFQTLSQAVLTRVGQPPISAPEWRISVPSGGTVDLTRPDEARILGFVTGADSGTLTRTAEGWTYAAPPDFTGVVELEYVVSDDLTTAAGSVFITVGDE